MIKKSRLYLALLLASFSATISWDISAQAAPHAQEDACRAFYEKLSLDQVRNEYSELIKNLPSSDARDSLVRLIADAETIFDRTALKAQLRDALARCAKPAPTATLTSCTREQLALSLYEAGYHPFDFSKNPLTNGIETEGLIPNRVGLKKTAEAIRDELIARGLQDVRITHSMERYGRLGTSDSYRIKYARDGTPYEFEVKEDYSVQSTLRTSPLEIASPIIRNDADYEDYASVIAKVRNLGAKAEPNSGAMQTHIGLPDATPSELRLLGWILSKTEKSWKRAYHSSASREYYIKDTDPDVRDFFLSGSSPGMDTQTLLETYFGEHQDKFHASNMHSMLKLGTLEVRLANSTFDPVLLSFTRKFINSLIVAVRSKDPRLMAFLRANRGDSIEFKDLAQTMGMSPAEVGMASQIALQEAEENALSPGARFGRKIWNLIYTAGKSGIYNGLRRSLGGSQLAR